MNDCKHKYYINEDKQTECRHCGLLKSTIESGDTAPIINKAVVEKREVLSPDSWEKEFNELFSDEEDMNLRPVLYAHGINRINGLNIKTSNKLKSFIRNLVSEARLQGREEGAREKAKEIHHNWGVDAVGIYNKAVGDEKSRIVGVIEGMKHSHKTNDEFCEWNQALEELKKRI